MSSLTSLFLDRFLENFTRPLQEGPLDPNILKCVFLAGSGGSGKGFIGSLAGLTGMGFKFVNVDDGYEYLLKKHGMNPQTDIFTQQGQDLRAPAKRIMNSRMALYIDGRLPMVIDATAAKDTKTLKLKDQLEAEGYDTAMILVDVTEERSIAGNAKRAKNSSTATYGRFKGQTFHGRNIDDHPDAPIVPKGELGGNVLRADWRDLQTAKPKYKSAWGRYFLEVDNNSFLSKEDVQKKLGPAVYKAVVKMIGGPVRNPIGKAWIKAMNAVSSRASKTSGGGGLDSGERHIGKFESQSVTEAVDAILRRRHHH